MQSNILNSLNTSDNMIHMKVSQFLIYFKIISPYGTSLDVLIPKMNIRIHELEYKLYLLLDSIKLGDRETDRSIDNNSLAGNKITIKSIRKFLFIKRE